MTKIRHQILIRSPQDDSGDTFGQLVLVNAVNGQPYVFDVMKDEELDVEQEELYHSLFLSGVVPRLNLKNKEATQDKLFDAMVQLGLDDILVEAEFKQVFQKIIEFELKGIPFTHEVPANGQWLDLNGLIIEEEINRLVLLVLEDNLTKRDIVDFGRLLHVGEISFELPRLNYFAQPFGQVLSNGGVCSSEEIYVAEIKRVLGIDF